MAEITDVFNELYIADPMKWLTVVPFEVFLLFLLSVSTCLVSTNIFNTGKIIIVLCTVKFSFETKFLFLFGPEPPVYIATRAESQQKENIKCLRLYYRHLNGKCFLLIIKQPALI